MRRAKRWRTIDFLEQLYLDFLEQFNLKSPVANHFLFSVTTPTTLTALKSS